MLSSFWHWYVIILTLASVLGCWWLLQWTKGISNRQGDDVGTTGHTWDSDLEELNNPLPRWWLYLFHMTIVFTLVYLALFPGLGNVKGLLGWTQLSQYEAEMAVAKSAQADVFARFRDQSPEALMADPEALGIGRRVFANNCAMCHGSDARGAQGFPNLTDDAWLYGGSFETVLDSITDGRQGFMPPLGAVLGETGVREVVAYVQRLSGQDSDAELAAAGQARFNMVCVACHGAQGTGNKTLGAPDLTDGAWLYGGDAESLAETVISGRSGKMPEHEHLLEPDQLRLVAVYVLSLSARGD
jgi:cytochrome c oxidase cbb3-type subunit 3